MGVVAAVIGGLAIAWFGVRVIVGYRSDGPTIVVQADPMPMAPVFVAPAPPQRTIVSMQAAKAQYEHDRDAVRKARPQTEAEIVKLLGRKPDSVIDLPQMTMLHWSYESKPEGLDILQVTIQGGKITIMNL